MTESAFKFDLPTHHKSIIKVIGVGGGGSNAVNHMYNQGITGVDFIVCNTDSQALNTSPVPNKLQIGVNLTEGLGAGANPEKGKDAALENKEEIRNMLSEDTKMVFITAGMGGGTGTGAAPVIAQVAKELGILTVGIVTMPFRFEGKKKFNQAMAGADALKANCDTVLVILNDKLLEVFGNLSLNQAFGQADNVLTTAAKGIAEIITVPGYVNVDFEDVKTVMADSGGAVMGSAETTGENRAIRAAEEAINSPLLNNQNIAGAEKILLSIISGDQAELKMDELMEITDFMQDMAGDEAEVIFGHGVDSELGESIRVTIIATGFDEKKKEQAPVAEVVQQPQSQPVQPTQPVQQAPVAPVQQHIVQPQTPQQAPMTPSSSDQAEKKYFDLNRDSQYNLFTNEAPENNIDETFEQDFQSKMRSFEFMKPEPVQEQPSAQSDQEEDKEAFNLEMQELFLESQKNPEPIDAPLEELNGMAHPPSRKIQLMEQSEARRKKLEGISEEYSIDTNSYKEKFEVPAYQRKQVSLKKSPMSNESLVSRYNLNGDSELGNNKFLHDNVD
ncbi:cell division protein FtsZ [Reichenbachiella versicolor]|uniref:cell division protein FtsZ n=1 Tax=Reichenbachiella versicolor TaxID=1821036 RepID=UPI000D6EAEEF